MNVNILERDFQVLSCMVPQLQSDIILGIPFLKQSEVQMVQRKCEILCFVAIMKFFVDSASQSCPDEKSAGCQLRTLEDFFKSQKTKWPP